MNGSWFAWFAGCLLWSASALAIDVPDEVLEEEFGKAVHAYFSGNYRDAHRRLSETIDAGIRDPRAYYFRGLACLNLGREPDARADFAKGAEVELTASDQFYDVSKSLERVQGRPRSMLESYRIEARVAAARQREKRRIHRYETMRQLAPPPPATTAPAEGGAPPAAPPPAEGGNTPPPPGENKPANPFGNT